MKNTSYLFISLTLFLTYCKSQKQTPQAGIAVEKPTVKEVPVVAQKVQKVDLNKINSEDSLNIKIGQMIMIGLDGRTSFPADDTLRRDLKANKIGGVILFEKNIAKANSAVTLKKFIADVQAAAPIPLFVSIDEEGGKVHRLKEKYGFVSMPSQAYLGKFSNTDSTYWYVNRLAKQLNDLGINLNYAPDVDLASNKSNPIIAKVERAYSADPKVVTKHALANLDAHHQNDVKTILKHFPGHGSSAADTHLGVVDVTNQWNIKELMPYNDIIKSGKIDAIMTAHIVNCHLDSACLPGTLSKAIVNDMLRNMLEFDGVVFSDDMQMYAISKNYGLEASIRMAINAGVDILVFGNQVNPNGRNTVAQLHEIIRKAVKAGEIPESRINQSYLRIMALKAKKFDN